MLSAFHTEKEDGAGEESSDEVMNKIKNTSTLCMNNRRNLGPI